MLQNISRLCRERGITLAELERESGLGRNTVYRWDANKPSVDRVRRVADYFGVTVDELLRAEDDLEGVRE